MSDTDKLRALAAPFPASQIYWRIGATNADKTKGMALAYIDARSVMERLDEVMSPLGWQCRYPFAGCCDLGLNFSGVWFWKSNGAGQTDVEGEKGQYSDAFKRAAVLWAIGRYLYELPSPWVAVENSRHLSEATQADLMQRLDAWQKKRFATEQ